MSETKRLFGADSMGKVFWNFALIAAGSALMAIAVNGILAPHGFLSGGFVGLALLLHYLHPGFNLALMVVVFNIPVFILGYRMVGRRFFLYSLLGALASATALELVHIPVEVGGQIPSALLAAIISGVGCGLVLRSYGSLGGVDILSIILLKKWSIRLGTTTLAFNAALLSAAVFTTSLDAVLHTLIYMYVWTKVMNMVVTGFSQRRAVLIISSRWEEISLAVLGELRRGATVIPAQGAYSGQERHMIYTVVSIQNLGRLKDLVRGLDPDAFVVITDTLEVMGYKIGNQPHW